MRTLILTLISLLACPLSAQQSPAFPPSAAPLLKQPDNYFPIAVWLQSPRNAERYKSIGVNLFIGLYRGPTEEHLATLKKVGMPVVCHPNELARTSANRDIIVAFMHGDEPDNAQSLGRGRGYGPPILPSKIEDDYKRIHANNPGGIL